MDSNKHDLSDGETRRLEAMGQQQQPQNNTATGGNADEEDYKYNIIINYRYSCITPDGGAV